jgi:tetratricopeptide (TPR) repeat protein
MKQGNTLSFSLSRLFALITLALLCAVSSAQPNEYAEVSQLLRTGQLAQAQAKADQYLAAKPRDPQMRFIKGVILRDAGKTTEAIAAFTKLTEDYPELPEPYNNLAVIYASQNQYDKARSALEMAIRTNPSYATAHENLGDVYAKLASQAYNKALQLDAGNTGVQPKLTLIREVFNANAKGQSPLAPATASTQVATASPATPPQPVTAPAASPAVAKPVAPSPAASMPSPTPAASSPSPMPDSTKDVEAAVRAWAKAWADKNMDGYFAAYSKEFSLPAKLSRSDWESERRQRITGKNSISVRLENLSVTVTGGKAVAKFRQDYRADSFSATSRKTLDLVKSGERWLIVKESTGN